MEIGWYLNHSNNPNVERRADGNLYTIRKIEAGEEILVDYNQYKEPEDLKDPCCKDRVFLESFSVSFLIQDE